MIGLIGGTSLSYLDFFNTLEKRVVKTAWGEAQVFMGRGYAFILRHGERHTIPPHKVNVRANLQAMKEVGAARVIGISSVGSMKKTIPIGSIVVPHDFLQLSDFRTIHDSFEEGASHIVPALDESLRNEVITLLRKADFKVLDGAVYMNTRGPRLETRAEVAMFSKFADVCGMTMANEAVISQELDLGYANISIVDNMAHGILREEISMEQIFANVKKNSTMILRMVETLLKEMV